MSLLDWSKIRIIVVYLIEAFLNFMLHITVALFKIHIILKEI